MDRIRLYLAAQDTAARLAWKQRPRQWVPSSFAALGAICLLGCMLLMQGPRAVADSAPAQNRPLAVQEVAKGVYVHQGVHAEATPENLGGIANIGFVIGDRSVAIIDTGGSFAEGSQLLAAVRQVTALPIAYVINTHFHPDHILGNGAFLDLKPEFVAHRNFPRDLAGRAKDYVAAAQHSLGAAFQGTVLVQPRHLVSAPEKIDLGHRILTLTPYQAAHSDADLTVLDENTGTLFTGDLVFLERVPAVDGSITGWLKAIDQLREVQAARAVPGHGPVVAAWPSALTEEQRYLSGIVAAVRRQLKEGRSLQQTVESVDEALGRVERSKWQLFDDYNGRNITAAYTELEWE